MATACRTLNWSGSPPLSGWWRIAAAWRYVAHLAVNQFKNEAKTNPDSSLSVFKWSKQIRKATTVSLVGFGQISVRNLWQNTENCICLSQQQASTSRNCCVTLHAAALKSDGAIWIKNSPLSPLAQRISTKLNRTSLRDLERLRDWELQVIHREIDPANDWKLKLQPTSKHETLWNDI